jgi:hypothetical protein
MGMSFKIRWGKIRGREKERERARAQVLWTVGPRERECQARRAKARSMRAREGRKRTHGILDQILMSMVAMMIIISSKSTSKEAALNTGGCPC